MLYRSFFRTLWIVLLAPPLWEFVTSGRTEPPPNTPSIKLEGGRRKERRGQIDGGAVPERLEK